MPKRIAYFFQSRCCDDQTQRHHPHPRASRLRRQGITLKQWAQDNGFKYRTVSDAVRGIRQGNFGEGREVRLKLGLPVND